MAITILPRSLGGSAALPSALGEGLASSLQGILGDKLEKIQQRQQASGLSQLLGVTPGQAKTILRLDPQVQKEFVSRKMQEPANRSYAQALSSILGGQPQEQVAGSQEQGMQPEQSGQFDLSSIAGLNPQQATQLAQLSSNRQQAQKKDVSADKKMAFAETRQYRDDAYKSAYNAKGDLKNLNEQISLIKSGDLIGPRANVFLDFVGNKFGFNEQQISAFKNPQSQVFEKLSVPYFRNLKQVFGARPTQWDAVQFQKGFPTLYQSKEGKEIIAEHMKTDAKIEIAKDKIINKLISNNNGIPPLDLRQKSTKILDVYRDKLYKDLKEKTSDVLVKTSGPTADPSKYKDQSVQGEDGVVYFSNGKRWSVKYS